MSGSCELSAQPERKKPEIITAHVGFLRSRLEKSEKLIFGHVRIYSGRFMESSHVV